VPANASSVPSTQRPRPEAGVRIRAQRERENGEAEDGEGEEEAEPEPVFRRLDCLEGRPRTGTEQDKRPDGRPQRAERDE
jgi:hypothetical protein